MNNPTRRAYVSLRMAGLCVAMYAALAASATPASAQYALNVRYTGVVTDVYDDYGLFGAVIPGDSVQGDLQYSSAQTPYYSDAATAYYDLPVAAGGNTRMTARVNGLEVQATHDLFVTTNRNRKVFGITQLISGYDFQFIDADISLLKTTGLPNGYSLATLSAGISLAATNASGLDFPDPPSSLLPLGQYDFGSTGYFSVDIFDAGGQYVDSAFINFQLTSVTSVPEPGSVALLLGLSVSGAGLLLRRRK